MRGSRESWPDCKGCSLLMVSAELDIGGDWDGELGEQTASGKCQLDLLPETPTGKTGWCFCKKTKKFLALKHHRFNIIFCSFCHQTLIQAMCWILGDYNIYCWEGCSEMVTLRDLNKHS